MLDAPMRCLRLAQLAGAVLALCLLSMVGGCTALLPTSHAETPCLWKSYDEARAAIEQIEPGKSTRADLSACGIDPYTMPNITILNYSDILLKFPVTAGVTIEQVDPGLRACFAAGKRCNGYLIQAHETQRDRVGNFWLDSLQFDRPVDVKGWSFNAIIVLVDDVVVYRLHGGQPIVRETERSRNPLGPFQGWGQTVPALVVP
jgi:hypothetical protein